MLKLRHITVAVLCLLALAFVLSRRQQSAPQQGTMVVNGETIPGVVLPPRPPCNYDWTKCKNANDLLKNDEGYRNILSLCKGGAWGALYKAKGEGVKWLDKYDTSPNDVVTQKALTKWAAQFSSPFKWDGVDYSNGNIRLITSDRNIGVEIACTFNLRINHILDGDHLNVPGDIYSADECRSSAIRPHSGLRRPFNCGIVVTPMK